MGVNKHANHLVRASALTTNQDNFNENPSAYLLLLGRGLMFDHLSLGVSNLQSSINFYNVVLAPLGIKCLLNLPYVAAYGIEQPMFWIGNRGELTEISPSSGFHLAFVASDRSSVDAFYDTAIKVGAKDDGKPGLRTQYHPNYYAAFVIDPDGYRIEAVCHNPE